MAVDQQVVEGHVHHVGHDIVDHGHPGMAYAPQSGGDGGGEGEDGQGQHLNPQIDGAAGQSFRVSGAHKGDQPLGVHITQGTGSDREYQG